MFKLNHLYTYGPWYRARTTIGVRPRATVMTPPQLATLMYGPGTSEVKQAEDIWNNRTSSMEKHLDGLGLAEYDKKQEMECARNNLKMRILLDRAFAKAKITAAFAPTN